MYFDTHLHLYAEDDARAVFDEARAAGVTRFLVAGTQLDDSRRAARIASEYPGVVACAGVHPHDAAAFDGNVGPFREILGQPGVVAVGEVGLDYYYDRSPRETQRVVFGRFLELAAELDMPVVVHCRDAYEDCLPILVDAAAEGVPLLLHSYTGPPGWAEKALELGAYFSCNGICTFPKASNVRDALAVIPLERLLLETDAPYLAPVPFRGKRNRPAYVVHVAVALARERTCDPHHIAHVTTANALRFFRIDDDAHG